jgi:hypothetical protein
MLRVMPVIIQVSGSRDQPVDTCDTCEWGTGFGQVAEGLPQPIPINTLPATYVGLPFPCHCLIG